MKKLLTAVSVVTAGLSAMAVSLPSYALDAAQNTQITDAYTGTGVTVTAVIAGLLAVGLIITGFGIIWSLIRK